MNFTRDDSGLPFVDALATFVTYWTLLRHHDGQTITFEELMGGFIGVMAAAIEQCDPKHQESILEAVHRALDDRIADPVGERERMN